MKLNNIFYAIAAMLLGSSVACTDDIAIGSVDKATSSTATIDTVFAYAEYTRQFVTGIYSMQYYGLPYVNAGANLPHSTNPYAGKVDALTDCWQMGWNGASVYGSYYTGSLSANTGRSDYLDGPLYSFLGEFQWKAIRSAWILIENIDKTPEMSDQEKARLIAECRCLMVARYFETFLHYGGIPIMRHSLSVSEVTSDFARCSVDTCVQFMVDQLDLAINDPAFPWAVSDPANENGRWTRAAARALKAKILQFSASPFLNPKDGQPYYSGVSEDLKPFLMHMDASKYQQRWDDFYQACKDFFDDLAVNGYYDLTRPTNSKPTVQDYRVAYRKGYYMQDSKEILLSTRHQGYDGYNAGRYCWHKWYTKDIPRNAYWPTQEYVEKFGWFASGRPFNYQTAFEYVYDKEKATPTDPGEGSENMILNKSTGEPNVSAMGLNSMFIRGTTSKLTQYLINVDYTRDPRLYEECIVNGMQKNLDWTTASTSGAIWELWAGGTDGLIGIETQTGMFGTGYGYNKYYLGDGGNAGDNLRFQTQWVYLSLNEMYLNYAEALCMKSNPDYTEAGKQIDIVRSRVGVKSISNEFSTYSPKFNSRKIVDAGTTEFVTGTGTNISELVEAILDERARELGLQDIRFFDMIRYKRTDWMTKQLHGLEMHRLKQNAAGEWVVSDTQWENSDKLNDKTSTQPKFFTYKIVDLFTNSRVLWGKDPQSNEVRRWLLSPFPQTEINKGYGLVQNPGWE